MKKLQMSEAFFNEFKKDPEGTMKRNNIEMTDPQMMNRDFKDMNYSEFQNFVRKSKMMNFFDMF